MQPEATWLTEVFLKFDLYLREAMLSRSLLSKDVCPSVHHTLILCLNE